MLKMATPMNRCVIASRSSQKPHRRGVGRRINLRNRSTVGQRRLFEFNTHGAAV
jgi:hypothetical protein